jgi:small subunit ribosomal protein S16
MLKIRLKRIGRKKYPIYLIVVVKNLSARNSKSINTIGYYNSQSKQFYIQKTDLFKYITTGAYPTSIVRHLLLKLI